MSDDYEHDHSGYSLDDVCDRLDNIEAAVKENHQAFSWLGLVIFGWFAFAGVADMWHSRIRYSLWYSIPYDQVTIQKKPTDCNFFHAPMGDKGCHYANHVSRVRVSPNIWGGQSISYDDGNAWTQIAKNKNGDPIVSHDGGTTWSTEFVPPLAKPEVIVSWEKVDDE